MEDKREEGAEPTPAEVASGEQEGAEDTTTQPDGGDIPDSGEAAEGTEEGDGTEVVETEEPDPLDVRADGEEPSEGSDRPPQAIPYDRFRKVIDERNDAKDQNRLLRHILKESGVSLDGGRVTKTKPETDEGFDMSQYTPKQVANAKGLVKSILKEELGLVGTLQEQIAQIKETQERSRVEQAAREDEVQMASALRSFKDPKSGKEEFSQKDVEAQIERWDSSSNPQLRYLARAPYPVILREMRRMRGARLSKKPTASPKVPDGGGGDGNKLPKPDAPKRIRPVPGQMDAWERRLIREANRRMVSGEGDE